MTKLPRRHSPARYLRRVLLQLLVLGSIVAVITIVTSRSGLRIDLSADIAGVHTAAIPGDASHFDPLASYDTIHRFAGVDFELASIDIRYVHSDGTVDLTANNDPQVDYIFFREQATPPPNMPPLGTDGVTDQPWDDQNAVYVQPTRIISSEGYVQGLKSIPPPQCSLLRLWDTAVEKDAPRNAVAQVRLDASGYRFRIKASHIDLEFDLDCQLKAK